jgi:hypothetical protein
LRILPAPAAGAVVLHSLEFYVIRVLEGLQHKSWVDVIQNAAMQDAAAWLE